MKQSGYLFLVAVALFVAPSAHADPMAMRANQPTVGGRVAYGYKMQWPRTPRWSLAMLGNLPGWSQPVVQTGYTIFWPEGWSGEPGPQGGGSDPCGPPLVQGGSLSFNFGATPRSVGCWVAGASGAEIGGLDQPLEDPEEPLVTPEPGTLTMFGVGLLSLAGLLRRRRREAIA